MLFEVDVIFFSAKLLRDHDAHISNFAVKFFGSIVA
jgi:hypothetical protein